MRDISSTLHRSRACRINWVVVVEGIEGIEEREIELKSDLQWLLMREMRTGIILGVKIHT